MNDRFVVDSSALISYFAKILPNADITISENSLAIIDLAFRSINIKLIFPSAVFIELYKKWCISEEATARIRSEIFLKIRNRENMEIQPFDKEILTNFILIKNIETKHNFDNHDKQILASAITMKDPLITSDANIIRYINKNKVKIEIYS